MGQPARQLKPEEVSKELWPSLDFNGQRTELYSSHYQTMIQRTCRDCGQQKWVPIANIRSKGDRYTARCISCASTWNNKNIPRDTKVGAENSNWKGGYYEHPSGYNFVHLANFEPGQQEILSSMAGKDRYIREHRAVMALHLGRPLHSTEIVHHRDGNKANNILSNLELCTTESHGTGHGSPYYQLWQQVLADVDRLTKRLGKLESLQTKGSPKIDFEEILVVRKPISDCH